jgi:asparagine synthase (glutamine-hydrolysing)
VYRHGQSHLFASEIKSILASGLHSGRVDHGDLRRPPARDTELDESRRTPSSKASSSSRRRTTFELSRDGSYRQWRYWTLDHATRDSGADCPGRASPTCSRMSCGLQMRSDVPVGVSLSGGLDSTSIICAAARLRERDNAHGPLAAFSFMTPEFDESRYIEATLAQTGATMHRLQTTPQGLWNDLRRMLWFQDEPVHTITAAVGYQLMELAASHDVKVLLNGQGADETLAGYPSYFRDLWHTLLGRGDFAGAVDQVKRFAAMPRACRPCPC